MDEVMDDDELELEEEGEDEYDPETDGDGGMDEMLEQLNESEIVNTNQDDNIEKGEQS